MFEKIRSAKLRFPPTLSSNAIDVLSKMLVRDPAKRLGCGPEDAEEIKGHPFFELINFEDLLSGRIIPQWRPAVAGSLDTSQFDREFTSMPVVSPDSNMFRGGSRSGGSNSLGSLFAHMDADQVCPCMKSYALRHGMPWRVCSTTNSLHTTYTTNTTTSSPSFLSPLPLNEQLKFPNFTYEAPSNMSDSASAFIEQLRAPPTSGEESGSASDFAFEATPAASAGGAAAGGLSNQFATVDEMGESFRRLLLLLLLLVTGRALRDIVTYPTRVSISLLPKLTPPSLPLSLHNNTDL
jgi:serine/threonine protein kinase